MQTQSSLSAQFVWVTPSAHVFLTRLSKAAAQLPVRRSSFVKATFRTCCSSAFPPFNVGILEDYTERVPSELLLVHAIVDDEEDEVLIYKGHSSSLMRATSADLGVDVLPADAVIDGIDRMKGPYNPNDPQYIDTGLSWKDFVELLKTKGFISSDGL